MDPATRELYEAAAAARRRAYSPYSGYAVGAAIRTPSGRVFTGCNVENASYPEGTCAEAGAIAAMVDGGERSIAAVVTVTGGATPGTPCGGCRQRIREFGDDSTTITATTIEGAETTMSLSELLPASFGPEMLSPGSAAAG